MLLINARHFLGFAMVFMALLALIAAGCGSGDGETDSTSSIPKAEYIQRADAICSKTEGRQELLLQKFGEKQKKQTAKSEAEVVTFAGLPPVQRQAEELAELPPPDTGAKDAADYIKALEAAVKAGEEDPTLLIRGKSPFAEAETQAQKFGFKVCLGP
jgi:hypothetical protein